MRAWIMKVIIARKMTKDIVSKLTVLLDEGIDSECKVLYLLAQIRKLLERDDPTHELQSLWMYCHWALHVDLDSPKTTGDFLERVNRWITNRVAYLNPVGSWTIVDEGNLFRDFIFLETFRNQLSKFLAEKKLSTTLCSDEAKWNRFVQEYSGVIEDGSLTFGEKSTSKAVHKVTFKKGPDLTLEHHVPFTITWIIKLKDAREIKTSMQTLPGAAGMVYFHHLEIVQNGFVPPV